MTTTDPFAEFKAVQREGWKSFAPIEVFTTMPAAALVKFAGIKKGDAVLDVACGTGPTSVTAARAGARVRALDLSPDLLERARYNASTAQVDIDFKEGDAEALPYDDGAFDVVVSQFGHMFAPRPEVVTREMLRVLKPGGRIAFSTWPPDQVVARLFALVGKYVPPPAGVAPPPQWGDPNIVRERLGVMVRDIHFDRELMLAACLSPQHFRVNMESSVGPVIKLVAMLQGEPARLQQFRSEIEALAAPYLVDNGMRQHYLMTRATKV